MSPVPKKSRLDESTVSLTSSDDGSPSGFIRSEVAVSDLITAPITSPKIEVLGMPWRLRVKKDNDSLVIYLYHRKSECDMWSIDSSIKFNLIDITGANRPVGKFAVTFNHKRTNFGIDVMKWEDVINQNKGFVKDGKIIIEARFKLSNFVGIRTNPHIEFTHSKERFHDVALVIDGEKIYASKQILAIHSLHFKAMFYGENADKNMKEIELHDIDRKELIEMLKLIYPSYTNITGANAEYLLKLSDLFQIKTILDQIEEFLIDSTKFNIPYKLNLSDKYKLVKLQEHCLDTFETIKDITDLQSTSGYEDLSRNVKVTLLEKVMKLGKNPVPQMLRPPGYDVSVLASDGSPSGFIRFEVNVSDITPEGIFSPGIEVLGLPWSLKVKKMLNPPSLGVFLYHRSSDSDIWSIDVSVELNLCNTDNENNIRSTFEKKFNHKVDMGCGPSSGLSMWEAVANEEKGFVKNDKIIVEARFILYNIVGIRINSHIDFSSPNEPFHDGSLLIEGEKIYVSKQLLAIYSPVFKTMFYRDFADKNKVVIELKDVDREEFIDMLNLIYPSYKKITDANVKSLLKLADRFQIKMIIDQVEQFLIDSKLNIATKLHLSDQYRLVTLQEQCLKSFKTLSDITDLQSIDGYDDLSKNMKGTLLEKVMKLSAAS